MTMVRFATTCDFVRPDGTECKKRSFEYEAWPSCRDCGLDICEDHMEGKATDPDVDAPSTCQCKKCYEREQEELADLAAEQGRDREGPEHGG